MNKDLTVGDPAKVLWKFCLPLFGSIIFQQLYNIADSFVAGKFIGENALAAVGNSYEITLIFIAFAFGCNIGCSVIVSQLFGAKKLGEMKTAVYTTFIASAVLCALLMLAGTLGCNGMLRLINTPENVFADSKLYLDIYIMGLPFVFFYNVATGIFSALGDSKTPFIFLAASSTSNIFMDILFVTAFKMGVAGVAWAVCAAPPEERGDRGKERDFLLSAVLPHCGNRRAEHFAAELHLRGQHRHSGRDQFVRFERDGGLLRLRQAQ